MPTIKKTVKRPWMPERVPFARRAHENREFYVSSTWRKARKHYLSAHPFCEECLRSGRHTPATVVDHIKPINQGGAPLDESNLQSLCSACHNKKSGGESWK